MSNRRRRRIFVRLNTKLKIVFSLKRDDRGEVLDHTSDDGEGMANDREKKRKEKKNRSEVKEREISPLTQLFVQKTRRK